MKQNQLSSYRNSILSLMSKNNIVLSELARAVNVSQPTLYRLLKGKTNDIKLSTLIVIAEYFSISLTELIGNPYYGIPIKSWKIDPSSQLKKDVNNEFFYPSVKCSDQAFALRSKPSFEKIFSKDTIFVIDPKVKALDGSYIIISYKNALEATLRKLVLDGPVAELQKIYSRETEVLTENITLIGSMLQSTVIHRKD